MQANGESTLDTNSQTEFTPELYPMDQFLPPGKPYTDIPLPLLYEARLKRESERHIDTQTFSNTSAELQLSSDDLAILQSHVNRKFLVGYDCKSPTTVKPVSSFITGPCDRPLDTDANSYSHSSIKTYQVVQYETRREFKGYRCEKYMTEQTFYCGNADHITPYPKQIYFRRPTYMDPDKCRKMHTIQRYTFGDGVTNSVSEGRLHVREYYSNGSKVYAHSSHLYGSQLVCEGAKTVLEGKTISSIVSFFREEVLYRNEKIIKRKSEDLVAFYENIRLPCSVESKFCVVNGLTFTWHIPMEEHCPLYSVQYFQGEMITHSPNKAHSKIDKVVMSTDNSNVRFVLYGRTIACGQTYYTTNYPEILVREASSSAEADIPVAIKGIVSRPVPADEVQLSKFIVNRDDFLIHYIDKQIMKEFATVLRDDCLNNLNKLKTEHFLDRKFPGYHTYRLGGSNYLTAAGEVVYFYQCKPVLVSAVQAEKCYDVLPISIMKREKLREYIQANGEKESVPKFFLEPLTHRITTVAKEIPCISKFFSRYRDIFSRWFAVTPQLEIVNPPSTIDMSELQNEERRITSLVDIDLSKGGLYDPASIDELVSWLENNRREEVILGQITHQVGNLHPGQYISPDQLFPEYTLRGGSWTSFILGRLWGFFQSLGDFFSTLFGIFLFARFVWYLLKIAMNCRYLYQAHGISPNLLWACCTEVMFTRHYWLDKIRHSASNIFSQAPPSSNNQSAETTQPGKYVSNHLSKEVDEQAMSLKDFRTLVEISEVDKTVTTQPGKVNRDPSVGQGNHSSNSVVRKPSAPLTEYANALPKVYPPVP